MRGNGNDFDFEFEFDLCFGTNFLNYSGRSSEDADYNICSCSVKIQNHITSLGGGKSDWHFHMVGSGLSFLMVSLWMVKYWNNVR